MTETASKPARLRPKDAATLILLDRAGAKPKVLMGKRHPGHKFMPGKFVFPGGRTEPGDRRMSVAGSLDPVVEERLLKRMQRPSPMKARALAMAAIRETFEETGLLLGSADYGPPAVVPEGPWADFAAHGVHPELDVLHFIARAITPPGRPKRFDARFFVADSQDVGHRVDGVVGPESELIELVWVPLKDARDLDLPRITAIVLDELEERLAAGMPAWKPVPFFHFRHGNHLREEL
jgi:8-oxo-dGTP pyrophosphatase MutT (NUDIX family)